MQTAPSRNSVRNSSLRAADKGQEIVGHRRSRARQLPDGRVAYGRRWMWYGGSHIH
jgi:hypothetical protein